MDSHGNALDTNVTGEVLASLCEKRADYHIHGKPWTLRKQSQIKTPGNFGEELQNYPARTRTTCKNKGNYSDLLKGGVTGGVIGVRIGRKSNRTTESLAIVGSNSAGRVIGLRYPTGIMSQALGD